MKNWSLYHWTYGLPRDLASLPSKNGGFPSQTKLVFVGWINWPLSVGPFIMGTPHFKSIEKGWKMLIFTLRFWRSSTKLSPSWTAPFSARSCAPSAAFISRSRALCVVRAPCAACAPAVAAFAQSQKLSVYQNPKVKILDVPKEIAKLSNCNMYTVYPNSG